MEIVVPVEKNSGVKMFGFSGQSNSGSGEYSESGQPATPTPANRKNRGNSRRQNTVEQGDEAEAETEQRIPSIVQHKLPQMLKVAVVGDSTSGKTAICEAYCRTNFTAATKYMMTIGVQIYGKTMKMSSLAKEKDDGVETDENPGLGPFRPTSASVHDERVNLILVDSSGKEAYQPYLPSYWEKLDAVALVVDLTCPTGLDNSIKYLEMAKNCMSPNASERGRLGVLIGNKIDMDTQRAMSSSSVQNFATEHNLEYFECSARNNIGLDKPFHFLAQDWLDRNKVGRESSFQGRDRSQITRSSYQSRR